MYKSPLNLITICSAFVLFQFKIMFNYVQNIKVKNKNAECTELKQPS